MRVSWPSVCVLTLGEPGYSPTTAPSHGRQGFTNVAVTVQAGAAAAGGGTAEVDSSATPVAASATTATARMILPRLRMVTHSSGICDTTPLRGCGRRATVPR